MKAAEVAALAFGGAAVAVGAVLALRRPRYRFGSVHFTPDERAPYGSGLGDLVEPEAGGAVCSTPTGRQIRLCMKRIRSPGRVISDGRAACELLRSIGAMDREGMYSIHLNTRLRNIGVEEIARGTVSGVEAHPREVFKAAILNNASAMILAHNHPSNDPEPSRQDYEITTKLIDAGKIIGINVLDHVVITESGGCRSLHEARPDMFSGALLRGRLRRAVGHRDLRRR